MVQPQHIVPSTLRLVRILLINYQTALQSPDNRLPHLITMNASTTCSNMNTEDGSLHLSQLSADLDLFEFFDMESGDDLFESANDGSFDLYNFMDVQMEEFQDPTNDDTKDQGPSSQSHTRISLDDDSFRSAFNEEPTPDDSFNSSASSPDHCNSSSSSNQNHSADAQYNSALQNLAESMKRTEESRRYVMQMQREMLTESQKKALSSAKEQLRQQNQMQQQPTTTSPVQHQASRRRNSSAMSSIISAGSQTVGRYMYRQVTM